ncbi:MAG TPA: hypothetical protein VE890_11045, partial [Thermoguttaceae bacterium]|nr:hypothetical protein [Thermoguttaceae bacterium]
MFHPGSKAVATAGDDRVLRTWEVSNDRRPRELATHPQPIYTLDYSPDGKMLATGGFENKVRVYGHDDGQLLRTLDAAGSDVRHLIFSPTGSHLAAIGRNGIVRVWDTLTWSVAADLKSGVGVAQTLAYSP